MPRTVFGALMLLLLFSWPRVLQNGGFHPAAWGRQKRGKECFFLLKHTESRLRLLTFGKKEDCRNQAKSSKECANVQDSRVEGLGPAFRDPILRPGLSKDLDDTLRVSGNPGGIKIVRKGIWEAQQQPGEITNSAAQARYIYMTRPLSRREPLAIETDSLFFDAALSLQLKEPWTSTLLASTQSCKVGRDHIDSHTNKTLTFSCILATESRRTSFVGSWRRARAGHIARVLRATDCILSAITRTVRFRGEIAVVPSSFASCKSTHNRIKSLTT